MTSNERNHRETEKEIQVPTKTYENLERNHRKKKVKLQKILTDISLA